MQRDRLPMFGLKSRYLRRRLSAPTSGSAKRRALERKRAQQTRAEGELLARRRREQRQRDKYEQQRQAREELASYEPWGRAGGGAPNPRGIRYRNLRAGEIYPEDELKGGSPFEARLRNSSPRRRKRAPFRLHEDPELCYAECLRKSVDNDIRYRQTPDQQKSYKQILDDMVCRRKKDIKHEVKEDLEQERKLGWTDNDIFNKIKVDHKRYKRSSLTLPKVKKDDDSPVKEKVKPSSIEKLPDINAKSNSDEEVVKVVKEETVKPKENSKQNTRKKDKFVKRLSNGERVTRIPFDEEFRDEKDDATVVGEKKPTPEATILRLTGGIELVPLLARQRRVGPRTLPSSDVTRAPEENCQWRELVNNEYLRELKSQMQVKFYQQEKGMSNYFDSRGILTGEPIHRFSGDYCIDFSCLYCSPSESRRESAESSMKHHVTWASLWGRPGHGAPQRGRYARNNLSRLLYAPQPLAPISPAI